MATKPKPKAKKRLRLRDPATPWLEAEDGPLYDGALADWEIERAVRREADDPLRLVIHPFHGCQMKVLGTDTRPKSKGRDGRPHGDPLRTVSYGLSCKGYDVRLGNTFRRRTSRPFSPVVDLFGDPAQLDRWETPVSEDWGRRVWLEAGECVLAETVETVRVPEDCVVIVLCKSTWAREFLHLNTTPLESGWCMSADTEILTEDGWRLLAGVTVGDRVLTRRHDGVAEYQPVQAKQAHPFDGNLLHFAGRSVDQLVTPDHELFVHHRRTGEHIVTGKVPAADVFGRHNFSFDRQVTWDGPEPSRIVVAGREWDAGDFLEFYGSWLGDGSAYLGSDGGYHVKLAVVTKEEKRRKFKAVLARLGVMHYSSGWGFQFCDKALCLWLRQHGHARDKFIHRDMMGFGPVLMQRLLDGLMQSDGCALTNTYSTVSRRLADDVQEVIYKCGRAAIVREVTSHLHGVSFQGFTVRDCGDHMTPKMRPQNHRFVPYTGMVYDVTVPNHVFFSRRAGKASWTGNCGTVTLELKNLNDRPLAVYPGHGIGQLVFIRGGRAAVPYHMRAGGGTYQDQAGPTPARV